MLKKMLISIMVLLIAGSSFSAGYKFIQMRDILIESQNTKKSIEQVKNSKKVKKSKKNNKRVKVS